MKSNLEINPERIKKAAMENPCAKAVLESLFPEVFDEGKPFKIICIVNKIIGCWSSRDDTRKTVLYYDE